MLFTPLGVVRLYLYVLVGGSLIVLVSPMIVISVPLLVLFGWPAFRYWRHRHDAGRVGSRWMRWWLVLVSGAIAVALIGGGVYWLLTIDPVPAEGYVLCGLGLLLAPLTLASGWLLSRGSSDPMALDVGR